MTMWGFASRKELDGSNLNPSTQATNDEQVSPSKRSRRRMGRKRGGCEADSSSTITKTNVFIEKGGCGMKQAGPLNISKPSRDNWWHQQHQPFPAEQAPGTSRVVNQKESLVSGAPQEALHDQQQDLNVDATDGQGIEILLDYNSNHSNSNSSHVNNRHQRTCNSSKSQPATPCKGHHHSRRSMSNHHKSGRRSAPPEPQRLEQQQGVCLMSSKQGYRSRSVALLEEDVLAKHTKIHRAQFSVSFPISTISSLNPQVQKEHRRHRIPFRDGGWTVRGSYDGVVKILQSANPVDEVTSVRLELKKTEAEIDALDEDKEVLEKRWLTLSQKRQSLSEADTNVQQQQQLGRKRLISGTVDGLEWDIHRLLNSKRVMSTQQRAHLELKRGRCVTVYLENPRSEEAFLNKCCGAKQVVSRRLKRRVAAVTMEPHSCRAGGAGATIRHLSVLPKGSSFFVSRDNGKSYSWGQLPPRLLYRMKSQGMDPVKYCGDLIYLSTGPNGYYFAEFRSGECWWGCSGEDKEFHDILKQWEIYRVVFGSSVTLTATDSLHRKREIITNSWIILGRDGRAAWKNLPSRLHRTLERRLANSAAPAEVALGTGDSYYVRFLDGRVDYSLPAELASVCEHIQTNGGCITDIALNPVVSNEFMVRHTEALSC